MACLADGYTTKVEPLDCHVLAATSAKLNICYWLNSPPKIEKIGFVLYANYNLSLINFNFSTVSIQKRYYSVHKQVRKQQKLQVLKT